MSDPRASNERFAVGEVAIYVRPGSPHHGDDVTIVSGPRWISPKVDLVTGEIFAEGERFWGYSVEDRSGRWVALPQWLQKKKPPRNDLALVRWNECPWQPETIHG